VAGEKTDLCTALKGVFASAKFGLRHRYAGGFRVCAEALPDKLRLRTNAKRLPKSQNIGSQNAHADLCCCGDLAHLLSSG